MTRADMERWKLEHDLLEQLMTRIEQGERAILAELRCPSDPVSLYAILNGERSAPWPKKTAARAKQRARCAMHVLVHLSKVRQYTGLATTNAPAAAYAALIAGLYAGDANVDRMKVGKQARKAGSGRGRQIAAAATKRYRDADADLRKYAKRWNASEEYLQMQYPTLAEYLRKMTGLSRATVYRRLKRQS
ncbi:MAG TPA: hypothetical protein VNJ02_01250 [Vicinamibacterales bacterium]|nr:hypothetical protein [Vicinamibacterales bacterium]